MNLISTFFFLSVSCKKEKDDYNQYYDNFEDINRKVIGTLTGAPYEDMLKNDF